MAKVNIPREIDKNLIEINALLEEELKDIEHKAVVMERHGVKKTLCSTIRNIYEKVEDVEVRDWCIEATVQAKKMAARLVEYRKMLQDLQDVIDSVKSYEPSKKV